MASFFENAFAATVVVGGVIGAIIAVPTYIYKAFWGEDTISPPEVVVVSAGPEMKVHPTGAGPELRFVVPPKETTKTLTMHIVDYNYPAQTYGTIKKMEAQGLRPTDLAECEAYITHMQTKGKVPDRVFCLGTLHVPTGPRMPAESKVYYSAIYPKESAEMRYSAKGILTKKVRCKDSCLAIRVADVPITQN